MGIRTYYNGISRRAEMWSLLERKGAANSYTSYGKLSRKLSGDEYTSDQVRANLWRKVEGGFISLKELVEGGRASLLFNRVGIYYDAISKLATRQARILSRSNSQLERFLLKGGVAVPYVVEHLLPEDVAWALFRCSETIRTRSVKALQEVQRLSMRGEEEVLKVVFDLQYDEQQGDITTRFFPGSVQRTLSFNRQAKSVVAINRGAVITDRWVANLREILDVMGRQKTSLLDQILICLSDNQGRVYPDLPTMRHWPEGSREEIVKRDHFTEVARQVIHEVVISEYQRMLEGNGIPLSFRPYIAWTNSGKLDLTISWSRGS